MARSLRSDEIDVSPYNDYINEAAEEVALLYHEECDYLNHLYEEASGNTDLLFELTWQDVDNSKALRELREKYGGENDTEIREALEESIEQRVFDEHGFSFWSVESSYVTVTEDDRDSVHCYGMDTTAEQNNEISEAIGRVFTIDQLEELSRGTDVGYAYLFTPNRGDDPIVQVNVDTPSKHGFE